MGARSWITPLCLSLLSLATAEVSVRDTTVSGNAYLRFMSGPGVTGTLKIAEERGVLRASLEGTADSVLVIFDRNPFAQMSGRTRPLLLPPRVTKTRLVVPKASAQALLERLGLTPTAAPPFALSPSAELRTGLSKDPLPVPTPAPTPHAQPVPVPEPQPTVAPLAPEVSDSLPTAAVVEPEPTPEPEPQAPIVVSHPEKKGTFTVVIDAGHGGKDPGATGKIDDQEVLEKVAALQVARKLRDQLLTFKDIKVVMTRDKDEFLELAERTRVANAAKGDLFVSLHCNSLPTNSKRREEVHGFMVYLLREAKDENDRAIERRENEAIRYETGERAKKQSLTPVEWMLLEHQLNLFTKESERLAGVVVRNLSKQGTVAKERTGAGQAGFFVLVGALMPSVLIEMGYVSNPQDVRTLSDPARQKHIAESIAKSIEEYRKTRR